MSNGLGVFANFTNTTGTGIVHLEYAGADQLQVKQNGSYSAWRLLGRCIRYSSTKQANNDVRETLLQSLGRALDVGIKGEDGKIVLNENFLNIIREQLGEDVLGKGFTIKDGHVISGSPLTERRIAQIVKKVGEVKPGSVQQPQPGQEPVQKFGIREQMRKQVDDFKVAVKSVNSSWKMPGVGAEAVKALLMKLSGANGFIRSLSEEQVGAAALSLRDQAVVLTDPDLMSLYNLEGGGTDPYALILSAFTAKKQGDAEGSRSRLLTGLNAFNRMIDDLTSLGKECGTSTEGLKHVTLDDLMGELENEPVTATERSEESWQDGLLTFQRYFRGLPDGSQPGSSPKQDKRTDPLAALDLFGFDPPAEDKKHDLACLVKALKGLGIGKSADLHPGDVMRALLKSDGDDESTQKTKRDILTGILSWSIGTGGVKSELLANLLNLEYEDGDAYLTSICDLIGRDKFLHPLPEESLKMAISAKLRKMMLSCLHDVKSVLQSNGGGFDGTKTFTLTYGQEDYQSKFVALRKKDTTGYSLANFAESSLTTRDGQRKIVSFLRFGQVGLIGKKGGKTGVDQERQKAAYRELMRTMVLKNLDQLKSKVKFEDGKDGNRMPVLTAYRLDMCGELEAAMRKCPLTGLLLSAEELGDEFMDFLKKNGVNPVDGNVKLKLDLREIRLPIDSPNPKDDGPLISIESLGKLKGNLEALLDEAEGWLEKQNEDVREKVGKLVANIRKYVEDNLREDQIRQGFRHGERHRYSRELTHLGSHAVLLASLIGHLPSINCNWGRDRTSAMDSEIKFLALQLENGEALTPIGGKENDVKRKKRSDMVSLTGNSRVAMMVDGQARPINFRQGGEDSDFASLFFKKPQRT